MVVERFRADEITTAYRFRQFIGKFADGAVTTAGLAAILTPFLFIAALTLDLPFSNLDGWATSDAMRPSLWISHGDVVLGMAVLTMVVLCRRFGAPTVSGAWGLSWVITLIASTLMLLYLSPQLTSADMPRGLYMVGLVVSWYVGGQAGIRVYDATRGGRWWRAPFLGAMAGLLVQAVCFFPIAYSGTQAPWGLWMTADAGLKILLAGGFLGVYRLLRSRVIPRFGLGGR